MPHRGVGPAGKDFHAAGDHMNHGRSAGRQAHIQTFRHSRLASNFKKPHFARQLIRVVVRLVVEDEDLAVGWTVFQNGNQGIVQKLWIPQTGMMMDSRGTGVVPRMNALRNYSDSAGYEVYSISPIPRCLKRPVFSFPDNALPQDLPVPQAISVTV